METSLTATSFVALPAHARVWVFKSATPFTPWQTAAIRQQGRAFTGSWSSHGDAVISALEVLADHFVVLAADLLDMKICGGAVDASVQFIKALERDLGLSLTDRMVVLYEEGGTVRSCRADGLEAMIRDGRITGDTLVYDDLVGTKADLGARFRVPLRATWMARHL